MLPELQGRLPIRVELDSLSKKDFKLILTETQNSLIKQYVGLLGTEKVELNFDDNGINKIAELATEINYQYPGRYIRISVAEDNENGCEMEYPLEDMDGPDFEDTDAIADVFDSLK